ncbi:MAG TPA: XdhC family protein [Nakamurella sp.]
MYDIALSVQACVRAGTRVEVGWVVRTQGVSSRDNTQALALTPGGGRIGRLLDGALDDKLADAAGRGASGRLLDLEVRELEASLAGLSCGGRAEVLLVDAATLPVHLWELLREREPVCLVIRLDGERVVGADVFTTQTVDGAGPSVAQAFDRRTSGSVVEDDTIVTTFWPVPHLVVVGGGLIADGLTAAAGLLGWNADVAYDAASATGLIAGLAGIDKIVVLSHDVDLAGATLLAALESPVGYIGALGSRRTQQARADWLAYRDVTDLDRICGPAGLDIGANTPAEIALSVLAEALAAQSGRDGRPLRERSGSIHA